LILGRVVSISLYLKSVPNLPVRLDGSGSSNAYTATEDTVYYFDVDAKYLEVKEGGREEEGGREGGREDVQQGWKALAVGPFLT
jgi:hypothetical protein